MSKRYNNTDFLLPIKATVHSGDVVALDAGVADVLMSGKSERNFLMINYLDHHDELESQLSQFSSLFHQLVGTQS